jgi:Tol biopolymer transport system component
LTNTPTFEEFAPSWSPHGTRIVYQRNYDTPTGNTAEAWVMSSNGAGARALATPGAFTSYPAWSPDGAHIAVATLRGIAKTLDVSRNTDASST